MKKFFKDCVKLFGVENDLAAIYAMMSFGGKNF